MSATDQNTPDAPVCRSRASPISTVRRHSRALRARRDDARSVARFRLCAAHATSVRRRIRKCFACSAAGHSPPVSSTRSPRSAKCSRHFGHITTPEHPVPFRQAARRRGGHEAAGRQGVTTRACGNSVRNITACRMPACPTERFDVTPCGRPDALPAPPPPEPTLPRKFKIAFEVRRGSHRHRHQRPRVPAGTSRRTARAVSGYGKRRRGDYASPRGCCTSSCRPRSASRGGVARVFKQFGDYQHKQRNRMVHDQGTGWDRWFEEYTRAREACRRKTSRARSIRRRVSCSRLNGATRL